MDGWITIGTKLDNSKFDKDIRDLENKLKSKEDKKVELEVSLSNQEQELERAIQKTDELANAYERLGQVQEKVAEGKASVGDFMNMQEIQNTYGTLEQISGSFDKALDKQEAIAQKVENTKIKYNELNNEIDKYKVKLDTLNMKKHQSEIAKVRDGFKSMGSSIQKSVSKIGKLVLGIFAVRSAYMYLRRASSELANYDSQYASDLEYIRYVLTQAIAPVLRGIVQLALQLLGIINTIVNTLFGVNLFAKGSAESFNKMKAGAGGVAKSAKEIKKQLAGFDEINVLSDQSDTSGGGGGGAGGVAPSVDLSKLQGELPSWMKWILDHGNEVIAILAGLGAVIVALKIGEFLKTLGLIDKVPLTTIIGIGLLIAGIVYSILELIDYLNDPTWENFGGIIQGIGIALLGLAVIIGSVPLAVAGAVIAIVGTIIKYWDQIKAFLDKGIDWLMSKSDWVHEHLGDIIGLIYDNFVSAVKLIINIFDNLFKTIKGVFDGIIKFIKGVFTGDWKMAWEGIKQIFSSIWNGIKGIVSSVWDFIKNLVVNVAKTTGDVISKVFKAIVNGVLGAIEKILNSPIRAINSLIGVINKVPGINLGKLNTFSLPRMKTGGIINMPNKGTMIGGMALGGEAGREGVIPLTDQQAMAELGREIGKNVLVNLTNITQMNGRVIGRELKNIKSEQDFAYNT